MRGRTLLTVLSTLVALTSVSQSRAQTSVGADVQKPAEAGVEDILITATRQATNLQSVPIAVTAVTAETLEQRGITDVGDLTSVVPNSQFRRVQGAFGPGVSAFIRGIGSGDTSLGGESAVAFYIDDVYYPLLLAANFDLLDIDHIEVLRGPQGTLFGRNALAGAVNIVGRTPSMTETTGYAELTTGAFERRDLRAGFNLPLGENAAILVSGLSKQRDGYVKVLDFPCEMTRRGTPQLAGTYPTANALLKNTPNFHPDDCSLGTLGGENIRGGRASLLWSLGAGLKLTLNADYIRDLSENTPDTVVLVNPTRANNNVRTEAAYFGLTVDDRFLTGDPFSTYVSYTDRIPAGTTIAGNTYYNGLPSRGGYQLPPQVDVTSEGFSGRLVWELGRQIDLTAIVGHRQLHDIHDYDTDGTPLVVEHTANDIHEDHWNAEVRLSGRSKWLDWVAGAFYYDGTGIQHAAIISPATGNQRTLYTTYDPTSKAVFGNATLRPLGGHLSFILGARYSKDQKVVNFSNLADTSPSPTDIRFQVTPHQSVFSWKAGVSYEFSDTMLLYTSASTGDSLPGYNPRPLQATQVFQFDGNKDVAYELGTKLDLLNRHLRLDGAVFYTDFKNRPTAIGGAEATLDANNNPVAGNQQLIPLPGGPPGSTQCSTQTLPGNTGIVCIGRTYYINQPASVRGAELEYTITPIDRLLINGSVGWSRFWSPDIAARTVNKRQSNPFWTASAGLQYELPVERLHGTFTPRLDWTYESSQIVSGTSTALNYLLPAHSLFNGRLSYDNRQKDFTIALGVTNLFNKFSWVNVFDYQPLGYPTTMAQPAPPREWYVTLRKSF